MTLEVLLLWTATVIIAACAFAFCYIKWQHEFWARLGVPYERPSFLYGSLRGVGQHISLGCKLRSLYDQYRPIKVFGIFLLFKPVAVVCDLHLIKTILIQDFHQLSDRGLYWNDNDPLSVHLVSVPEDRWRAFRSKLSPAFSSGKLKSLMPNLNCLGDKLAEKLREGNEGDVNVRDIFIRYTIDVIGNCAFGLDCKTMNHENEDFLKIGHMVFNQSPGQAIITFFAQIFPNFSRFLNIKTLGSQVHDFFLRLVKGTVERRERAKVPRSDLLEILMNLKVNSKSLTIQQIAAQVLAFHLAGYESSASTLTFACYELAMNPEVQQKARTEVQSVLREFNNELSYEALFNMPYVDQVINESLRKYPPAVLLWRRVAVSQYRIPGTNVVLKENDQLAVSVFGIHRDPEIYPDPEIFDPDRFLPKNISKRHSMAFIPFGEGPRNCIGLRFAIMEIKVALVKILSNYWIEKGGDLTDRITFATLGTMLKPRDDLNVRFKLL